MAIKLTDEESVKLIELQQRWNFLTQRSGELRYQARAIDLEITEIDTELDVLDNDRFTTIQDLETKYGQGQINLLTGEFIPDTPQNGE